MYIVLMYRCTTFSNTKNKSVVIMKSLWWVIGMDRKTSKEIKGDKGVDIGTS